MTKDEELDGAVAIPMYDGYCLKDKEKQSKSRQKVKSDVALGTKKDLQGRSLRAELLQALSTVGMVMRGE